MGIRYVLMDIEGTISDISFVKETLFPYASEHLAEFLEKNQNSETVKHILAQVRKTQQEEGIPGSEEQALQRWILEDRKHPALKSLQGMVWQRGFENGDFRSPLYEDVLPQWRIWKELGLQLGIYSSGSVAAQKLFFKYTQEGNVLNYLSDHFDLSVGSKKEAVSYQRIARQLELGGEEVVFVSDVEEELDAAGAAGFKTFQALRPGVCEGAKHPKVRSFSEILF